MPTVSLLCAADLTPEPIRWLWDGWLARGKMHILGGAPGTGKTTLALRMAATVSTGGTWPDGTRASIGNVVVWSGEDDPSDTLTPRLIAAGADVSRCFFVGGVNHDGNERAFDPSRDIAALRDALKEKGGASLLIVDPIVTAVAGDSHKNAEVRRGLAPLCDLAASVDAALLGITHFSKGTAGREPTERITGSLAFGALARVVLIAAKKPDDYGDAEPERIFMRAKSNIGPDDGGYCYSLRQVDLEGHPGISASAVAWGAAIEGTAREILGDAEAVAERSNGAVSDASGFLEALLADGPMAVSEIKGHVAGAGLSWATIRRAKDALGIVPQRSGFGSAGGWEWSLPDQRFSKMLKGAQEKKVSTFGKVEHLWSESEALEVEI